MMTRTSSRAGLANNLYLLLVASVAVVLLLLLLLIGPSKFFAGLRTAENPDSEAGPTQPATHQIDGDLFMYCAAGLRYAMDQIVADYKREYNVTVQPEYQGSNTLLSQLQVSKTGDLFLAADDSYVHLAREKGLIAESIPLAQMRPVIAVRKENSTIKSIEDLLQPDVRLALGDPGAAAIGKTTKRLLSASGHWTRLEKHTTSQGVFKPTVNDVAAAVQLGSVDAGVIWDSTVQQYPELKSVVVPELAAGRAQVEIAVVAACRRPTAALRFARYVAARDRGLRVLATTGFNVVDGDIWHERPEITFFAGAVNRRALEPILKRFQQREGVTINTKYDGCGILTAQMRIMREDQASGFPDSYMACDVYYLNTVKDLFQDAVNVSDTDIVIAVVKGNPKGIKGVKDLLRPDVRLVLGHPDQCTIGVLSRRLLQEQNVYDRLMAEKDIPMKPTSAMLVPDVITGAADAALAYRTDTRAESNQVDTIAIPSLLSKAIQPYSIARSSDHKYLGRRLFDAIARSRDAFEAAGFNWRLDETSSGTNRVNETNDGDPSPL